MNGFFSKFGMIFFGALILEVQSRRLNFQNWNGSKKAPEEIGTEIVRYLLQNVARHLGHSGISSAVIAVPAEFNQC